MNRRNFLGNLCAGAGAFATLNVIEGLNTAFAADEVLDEQNPTAIALGYKHDATKVDVKKFPKRADGKQLCSNCNFAVGAAREVPGQKGSWVGCQLFPGKVVNEQGWCNSWIVKQG